MKKNLGIKIASVILAIALWVFVISRGYSDITLTSHVKFVNLPDGIQLVDSSTTREVSLELRGHEKVVKNMGPDDVQVTVDVGDLGLGTHQVSLDKRDIKLPLFVRLMGVNPSVLKVKLEEAARKSVPVKPYIVGSPGKGYAVTRQKISPGSVNVTGSKTDLDNLLWVKTDPVDIEGATRTVKSEARVALNGSGMTAAPATVTVEITIEKAR